MTTGVVARRGSRFSRRANVNPSTSGIWQSEITTSNCSGPSAVRRRSANALVASGDRRRCHAPAREHLVEDAAIGGIVIDHEHAQALERFTADRARRGRGLVRRVEVGGEMKRAALADCALDPHPAVHQLHEPLRDRQTEAGAAIAARGGAVRLGEGLKNLLLLLRRNADAGVGHGKVQRHPARAPDARPSRAAPLRRQR